MELTEETLKSIHQQAETAQRLGMRMGVSGETVLALVEEIMALREDKARLSGQLERVSFVAAARARDLQTLMESRD